MVIPTFIAITFVTLSHTFYSKRSCGDYDGERGLTPEVHQQMMKQPGLDLPLYQQYFNYIGNVIQGDFGESFHLNNLFWEVSRFPCHVWISFLCTILVINCWYYVRNDCRRQER